MKVMRICFGLLLLTIIAVPAASAGTGEFGVFGAYWDTKDLDQGWGAGLKWGTSFGDSNWDFDISSTYFDDVTDDTNDVDFDVRTIPVEVGVRYNFTRTNAVNIYLGAGGGYYFMDTSAGQLDDEVGYYGVLGLEAGHEKGAAFFVEVLYRQLEGTVSGVQSSGSPQHDTDVDIDLSGPAANVGVVWRY